MIVQRDARRPRLMESGHYYVRLSCKPGPLGPDGYVFSYRDLQTEERVMCIELRGLPR